MDATSASALEIMHLREVSPSLFEGDSEDLGYRQLFGGQVLGQCVAAAYRTVSSELTLHSIHGYFLLRGDSNAPVRYQSSTIRNGRSFSLRQIVASQGDSVIFTAMVSFHRLEDGPEHQATEMPRVSGPDGLISEVEYMRRISSLLPADRKEKLTAERFLEVRIVDRADPLSPAISEPVKYTWFRASRQVPHLSPQLHTALLAYASDLGIALTGLLPHGLSVADPRVQVASIDHGLWIHRPSRIDQWHLYVTESPTATTGRSFNRGQIFTLDGVHVASVSQEALLRSKSK